MRNKDYKKIPNSLKKHRRLRGLTQKEVAHILGSKSTTVISRWEHGKCLPKSIIFIFKLGILYRTFTESLFQDTYRAIKDEIHANEEKELKKNRSKKNDGQR